MHKALALAAIISSMFSISNSCFGQENDLNRDEVAVIKKKLLAVQAAIGQSPKFLRNSEDYQLPTTFSPHSNGKFYAINAGLSMRWEDKLHAESELAIKKNQTDYQQKYAAAMAKQDYQAIEKLSMDLQATNAKAMEIAMTPRLDEMQVSVQFNNSPSSVIDPDMIVLEAPGAIALFTKDSGNEKKGEVTLYLDPIALKDTKKLAKVELKIAQEGVANKVGVYHITVHWRGLLAEAQAWAKTVDLKALLAQVDK